VALPSTGGILVEIQADWESLGPYRVQLVNGLGAVFPQGAAGCVAPLIVNRFGLGVGRDDPSLCYVEERFAFVPGQPAPQPARFLRFTLPPLPLGLYAVRVTWGASWGEVVEIEDAVRIVPPLRCEESWRLASGLSRVWSKSGAKVSFAETLRADAGDPWPDGEDGPDPAPFGPSRALLLAWGEGLAQLSGRVVSLLSAPWEPLEDVPLESPLLFPSQGVAFVGEVRCEYDQGPDAASPPWLLEQTYPAQVDGVQRPEKSTVVLDVGTLTTEAAWSSWSLLPLSQAERALRDTLLTFAQSGALERLSALYAIPKPAQVSDTAWRLALRAAALGSRGTAANVHDFLEGYFSDAAQSFGVTLNPASPQTLTWASGGAGSFSPSLVGRFVRVEFVPASASTPLPGQRWETVSALFYVVSAAAGLTPATVELCPLRAGIWEACNFAAGAWAVHPDHTAATASFLAFSWREPTPGWMGEGSARVLDTTGTPCLVEVLTGEDLEADFPASYLLEPAGVDRASIDPLMPYGSQLMDLFNTEGNDPPTPVNGNQDSGPFPLYLGGTDDSAARALDLILPAGVHARALGWVWPVS
jgi:hypothetical protein